MRGPTEGEGESVTQLLRRWSEGDQSALDQLTPLVYEELRRLAASQMKSERGNHTLQPTALVSEVYLRLVDQRTAAFRDRLHFFGVAASIMRRILVDHARRTQSQKRGPGLKVPLEEGNPAIEPQRLEELLDIHRALERLAAVDARQARIVELRYFGGLTIEETAALLDISPATVKQDWALARLWLRRELDVLSGSAES